MLREIEQRTDCREIALTGSREQEELSAGCLFSGMGGFATGLRSAGLRVDWATDNDPFASRTFRHRFAEIPFIETDVKCLGVRQLTPVDILAGGFPCQSFSQAGARKGFDDPRGSLFFEIPRLLKEWTPAERPKFVVLENVPHLLYGADGDWFVRIRRALRQAGYWFRESHCWIGNVREYTDIPQDRERLFLVAASKYFFSYNPFAAPVVEPDVNAPRRTVLDIVDSSQRAAPEDYLPAGNQYLEMIEAAIAEGESPKNLYQLRRNYVREKKGGLCPTLTANMGIGGHNIPFVRDTWGVRRLRVEEVAALQGFGCCERLFPEEVPIHEQYRLIGNAACPALVEVVARQCITAIGGSP